MAAGLLNERAYADAMHLLELAEPEPEDPLHRTWLHKTVMAYRKVAESTDDAAEKLRLRETAKRHLAEAEDAGYRDSETYGIWGGLLKRQIEDQRAGMEDAVAQSVFAEMEQKYRLGFELDPDYYSGVNVVMALRWSGRPRHDAFRSEFNEVLTVSRFLARLALTEDPLNFWAAVTLAELTLHEALELGSASIDDAVRQYADAGRIGRPGEIESAVFQLDFLRRCGDSGDVIDRMLAALAADRRIGALAAAEPRAKDAAEPRAKDAAEPRAKDDTNEPRTFLCHSSGDKAQVRDLHSRLKSDGIRCWFDEEDLLPGQRWELEITKAIEDSKYVLACLSKSSIDKRGYVQKELKKALDVADEQPGRGVYLIPVRLEECEIPDRLGDFQWVDLFEEGAYHRLLNALRR